MHVLIIPSWFDPNAPQRVSPFIFEQAKALLLIGAKVGIIHAGFSGNRLSFTAREFDGIPIISANLPRALHKTRLLSLLILRYVYLILLTRYRARYGKASIVHAHGMYAAGISATAVARQLCVPFVVTEHHSGYSQNAFSPWQLKQVRRAAHRCAAIFFVSHSLLRRSAEYLPCRNYVVLPNNFSSELIGECETLSLLGPGEYFCVVARLESNKNLALCIRAYAELDSDEIKLVIVGTGRLRSELEALALKLGVQDRVVFCGQQSRQMTFAIIQSAKVLIVSSDYEAFGMTILEAAMLKTPVVATRCGGPEEILGKGFGMLIDVDDHHGLCDELRRAVDGVTNFRCGEAERIVSAEYSPDRIAKMLTEKYAETIEAYA